MQNFSKNLFGSSFPKNILTKNINGENITFGQILKEMQDEHGEEATRDVVIKTLENKNVKVVQT